MKALQVSTRPPGGLRLGLPNPSPRASEILAFARVQDHWSDLREAWADWHPRIDREQLDLAWCLKLEILRHAVFGRILHAEHRAGLERLHCSPAYRRMAWVAGDESIAVHDPGAALSASRARRVLASLLPAPGRPPARAAAGTGGSALLAMALDPPGTDQNSRPVAALLRAWHEDDGTAQLVCGAAPSALLRDGPWGILPQRLPRGAAPRLPPATDRHLSGFDPVPLLRRCFARLAASYAPILARHAAFWTHTLLQERPTALFLVNDQLPVARAAILSADALGIPSYSAHAVLLRPGGMYADLAAHYLCCLDPEMADCLVDAGIERGRIRISGFLHEESSPQAASARRSPPRRLLFCTENAAPELFCKALEQARYWARGDRQLRFRRHPAEPPQSYANQLDASVELSSGSLDQDLCWADLVLTGASTVGHEALRRDLPLLSICAEPLDFSGYGLRGEAIRVEDPADLLAALQRCEQPDTLLGLREARAAWRTAMNWPSHPARDAAAWIRQTAAQPLPTLQP